LNDYSFFSAPQLKRDPLGSTSSLYVTLAPPKLLLVGFALLSACRAADRSSDPLTHAQQRQVIAAVIESDVLALLDTSKVKTPVTWQDWWYTVIDNVNEPSPAVVARFRDAGFDTANPPPRPRDDVNHKYQVRRVHFLDGTTLEADVGPEFFGCVYRLQRKNDEWAVVSKEARGCWIS
jgi:hypothetical protein